MSDNETTQEPVPDAVKVNLLRLRPDDILIFKIERQCSNDWLMRLRADILEQTLIVEKGIDIEILRKEDCEK